MKKKSNYRYMNKFKMLFADTIRDAINVRSKADMSRLNLPHGNDN